jgi:hypothetical protein
VCGDAGRDRFEFGTHVAQAAGIRPGLSPLAAKFHPGEFWLPVMNDPHRRWIVETDDDQKAVEDRKGRDVVASFRHTDGAAGSPFEPV